MTPPPATSQDERRQRLAAATAAIAFHALLLAALLFTFLSYPTSDTDLAATEPESSSEITFEDVIDFEAGNSFTVPDELVKPDPVPQQATGAQTEAAPLPAPDPQAVQQQKREEIARRVKFQTVATSPVEGDGGNDATTTVTTPDVNTNVVGFDGFIGEGFPRPTGFSQTGVIAINVTLDADGRVIATSHNTTAGYGSINGNTRAVQECLKKAAQSQFRPRPGTTTGATGVIKYHFRKGSNMTE